MLNSVRAVPSHFDPGQQKLGKHLYLHLELFVGNPAGDAAPPPGAVPTVFILLLLRVIQASRETSAAHGTWQRAVFYVQVLLKNMESSSGANIPRPHKQEN